jgi:hypothetical protein
LAGKEKKKGKGKEASSRISNQNSMDSLLLGSMKELLLVLLNLVKIA